MGLPACNPVVEIIVLSGSAIGFQDCPEVAGVFKKATERGMALFLLPFGQRNRTERMEEPNRSGFNEAGYHHRDA